MKGRSPMPITVKSHPMAAFFLLACTAARAITIASDEKSRIVVLVVVSMMLNRSSG